MTNEHPKYPLGKKRTYPIIIRNAPITINEWDIYVDYAVYRDEEEYGISEYFKICGISAADAWVFENVVRIPAYEKRRYLENNNMDNLNYASYTVTIIDLLKDKMCRSMRNSDHESQFRILTAFDS
jgi:hypothetical protein